MHTSLHMLRRASLLVIALLCTAFAHAATLTTTYGAGNNHRGNMFDVTANQAIAITQFDMSPMGNTNYEIYYRVGTWVGHANSPGDWTLLQTGPVSANVSGTGVPVALDTPVSLLANETYAFYITSTSTNVSLNYSNGSNVGALFASDSVLSFFEGGGLEYPFTAGTGAVYEPRVWNGAIHYEIVGPASRLAVKTPATATQGMALDFSVTAVDALGYQVPNYTGTVQFSSSDATATLPGSVALVNGQGTYSATFFATGTQTIVATDTATSSIAGTSNNTLVAAAPVPDAPSITSAVAGNAEVELSWSEPADNGSAITEYVVTGLPQGSCTSVSTSCVVTGLTNGTSYTFTVVAKNLGGSSAPSAASIAVTPSADLLFAGAGPTIVLPQGALGQNYNTPIQVSGGLPPYNFALSGNLPAGLSLNTNTGVISGTPTTVQTEEFSITVMDSVGAQQSFDKAAAVHTATQSFSITITAAPVTATPTPVPGLGIWGLLALSALLALLGMARGRGRLKAWSL